MEAHYGYDTRHAMYLLRLLRMGMEILETGEVHVYRPDREWLLAVRNGLLTYEELLVLAAEYEARLTPLAASTRLPEAPDVAQVAELVVELQTRHLQETHTPSKSKPLACTLPVPVSPVTSIILPIRDLSLEERDGLLRRTDKKTPRQNV